MKNMISHLTHCLHNDIKHYRLEPFIDLSQNQIVGYEVLSQLKHDVNVEQWFARLSGRQQICLLLAQIKCVSDFMADSCFYNLSVEGFLTLNYCDIENIAAYPHICLEVADASALKFLNEKERYLFFKNINRLRFSGVKIWVDDFSIDDMTMLPLYKNNIDGVKIDKSEVHTRHLKDIVGVAKKVLGNVPVLIEGVESEMELNKSILSGADIAQGYYWKQNNLIAV